MEQQLDLTLADWLEMVRTYKENGWTEDAHAILDWLYANGHICFGLLHAYKV
jgi:hypothetical protein